MFEEFQEAALKEEQKKKLKKIIHIVTGVLFSIAIVLITQFLK